MKDIKEIKINKANGSITFINNGIAFSQFGIAKEILDLITNLQEELKYQKEAELEYNEKHTELMNMYSGLKAENETLRSDFKNQVECATNLQEENERLNKSIIIMEKYLELIHDLGYDYDGLNHEHDLKGLIDEMVRFASLGRACNTTEEIYVDGKGKSLNILGDELKEDNNG